ncbi:hypothetical protein DY000_02060371 [Brassica cretica]|uniref:DUF1985 domain-containing protein n=1 Tax=Brassica cretica TaxID=69181 RepID=A0ABQ7AZW2_BRACR|nr:hypothetical protein DY000_02060371 [Brassica cretica]
MKGRTIGVGGSESKRGKGNDDPPSCLLGSIRNSRRCVDNPSPAFSVASRLRKLTYAQLGLPRVTPCRAKDETILSPAAEYRKCHSPLARENFGDFPGSRKTRVINFVVLPTLGGKRPSAVGESSPAIIRPQTTPAVMTKSKLSQTTVRRWTRSSGEELPKRPPAKQQRYLDSGSEDCPGGGDSSGGQFSDGVPSSVLPRRLFAYGAYPTKLRVNIYSKSHVIGSVAAALRGTDAMDTLMASQFRGLFELPVVRCKNSTKLINCLLSRQLVTARRHEFWFTFGPNPLRFSLDEFRDVTGVPLTLSPAFVNTSSP